MPQLRGSLVQIQAREQRLTQCGSIEPMYLPLIRYALQIGTWHANRWSMMPITCCMERSSSLGMIPVSMRSWSDNTGFFAVCMPESIFGSMISSADIASISPKFSLCTICPSASSRRETCLSSLLYWHYDTLCSCVHELCDVLPLVLVTLHCNKNLKKIPSG